MAASRPPRCARGNKYHTIRHREQGKRENQAIQGDGAPGGENVGAGGGKETVGDEGGAGGDVSIDFVVSGDTSKTGYTSAVTETQSSHTWLGDINTEDAADNTTGSSDVR